MSETNIPSEIRELVEAILIIGARRANDSLTHESAKPLIEQHIDRLSERAYSLASKTIEGKDERIKELEDVIESRNYDIQSYREENLQLQQRISELEKHLVANFENMTERCNKYHEQVTQQASTIEGLRAENERLKGLIKNEWMIDKRFSYNSEALNLMWQKFKTENNL